MNDLERILEAGREVPTPDGLTEKIKDSIDGQIGTGATGGDATPTLLNSVPLAAWAAGLLIVGVIVALGSGLIGGPSDGESDTTGRNSSGSFAPLAGDLDQENSVGDSTRAADLTFDVEGVETDSTATATESTPEGTIAASGAIFGTVRDLRGEPIAGARVKVTLPAERRRAHELTVVTDETGFYEASLEELVADREIALSRELSAIQEESIALDALIEGVHFVGREEAARAAEEAVAQDLIARERQVMMKAEYLEKKQQIEMLARDLVLEQQDLEAQQRIVGGSSSEAMPAVDARRLAGDYHLRAMDLDRAAAEQARVLANSVTITALFEGFQPVDPVTIPFTPTERTEVDLVLDDAATLAGVVIDAYGQPVDDALVQIIASFDGEPLPSATTTTTSDPAGEFSFDFLPTGQFLVHVSGDKIETVTRWIDTGSEDLILEVPSAGAAAITVVDERGAPLFPVVVELMQGGQSLSRLWINGTDGERIEGLTAGDYGLRVFLGSGGVYPALEDEFTIAAGEEIALELVIPPAVTVEGTLDLPADELTEEGLVPSGRFLVAAYHIGGSYSSKSGAYSRVDNEGKFLLPDLPAGHYVFGVAKQLGSSMIIRSFRDVVLSAGNGAQVVRLPFAETELAAFEIRVEDENGAAISGASVTFERARTMGRSTHRTGKDGVYKIQLHPDPFALIVSAKGFSKERVEVALRSGTEKALVVRLEPSPTLDKALETALRGEGTIVLHRPITLRSLFTAIDLAEPGAIDLDRELAASRLLDSTQIGGRGITRLRDLLEEGIRERNLEFEVNGARLLLGFGEGSAR